MSQYLIACAPMPTTTIVGTVSTGTALKTLLQVRPSATLPMRIIEWGISFDSATDAAKIKCELIEADVAATVTACVTADIMKWDFAAINGGDPVTNLIQVGTTSTGYNASNEGTITATRVLDMQLVSPAGGYCKQFPLGREPCLQISKFARIRVLAPASVNAYAYMIVEI